MQVPHVSTEDLVDPRQIGWVGYLEGDALIYVKVIRGRGKTPFLSHISGHAHGKTQPGVVYSDAPKWKEKSSFILRRFREEVGDDYFFNAQPRAASAPKRNLMVANAPKNQV